MRERSRSQEQPQSPLPSQSLLSLFKPSSCKRLGLACCAGLTWFVSSTSLAPSSATTSNFETAPKQGDWTAALPAPLDTKDYRPVDPALARLGRLLFYDPILSGNKNISCGTCHNHDHASADGLSLPVGEGGSGIGPKRHVGNGPHRIERRVPRHSPTLFNLGHRSVTTLFHDGRLSVDTNEPSGFDNPLLDTRLHDLPDGLDGIVAAQAVLPLLAATEMTGRADENDVAHAAQDTPFKGWTTISRRVAAIPLYAELFKEAYDDIVSPNDIRIVHVANALADFIEREWRANETPFDAWLRGEGTLSSNALKGAELFFGSGGCVSCHTGSLLGGATFAAIAMPQLGPGRTRLFSDGAFDRGRINVTNDRKDAYRFRVPPLRNVIASAPYGHSGAYSTLQGVVRHHLDPLTALEAYDPAEAILPRHDVLTRKDALTHWNDRERRRIAAANELHPSSLAETDIRNLLAFLQSLTDKTSLKGRLGKPETVPSGLPVE